MQGARSRAMEPVKSRDRCAPRRTPRLKIFHGAEDFRSVHGRWPFGQTFSNGTSNTAKCLLSGKCTFNCTSKSKRQPLGTRACIVTRGAASVRSFTAFFPTVTTQHTHTHTLDTHARTSLFTLCPSSFFPRYFFFFFLFIRFVSPFFPVFSSFRFPFLSYPFLSSIFNFLFFAFLLFSSSSVLFLFLLFLLIKLTRAFEVAQRATRTRRHSHPPPPCLIPTTFFRAEPPFLCSSFQKYHRSPG